MQKFFLVSRIDKNTVLTEKQSEFLDKLKERLNFTIDIEKADGILVLGGDGTMLNAIRNYNGWGFPFYGFNFGHIGFLMNEPKVEIADEIIKKSVNFINVAMLKARIFHKSDGFLGAAYAFNDFYFERTTSQTGKFLVSVNNESINNEIGFNPLISDGIIVATPAGSTAYNASAGGKILPIDANNMVLTAICPAIFHNWRSDTLPNQSIVKIKPVETEKRPVRFLADGVEIKDVSEVEISCSKRIVKIGFGQSYNFKEKVLNLQFFGKI